MALMIFMAVTGAVTGGISAAHTTCSNEQKTQQAIQATQQFVAQSQKMFTYLQNIGSSELDTLNNLSQESLAACDELQSVHSAYIKQMQKLQIIALFVIVIVFMLLLGKKLKFY
jgi:hypothetical protein